MATPDLRAALDAEIRELQSALAAGSGHFGLSAINRALLAGGEGLCEFLISNDLWGGSGSIADQAGVGSAQRARIEQALAALGCAQLRVGVANERTRMWVSALSASRRPRPRA
jgi:hypothetical protein